MKHPTMHVLELTCSTCGNTFATRSAADSIRLDVCSNCHPAYTGVELTTARGTRIERFERRRALAAA